MLTQFRRSGSPFKIFKPRSEIPASVSTNHLCLSPLPAGGTTARWAAQRPRPSWLCARRAPTWCGAARPAGTTTPSHSGSGCFRIELRASAKSYRPCAVSAISRSGPETTQIHLVSSGFQISLHSLKGDFYPRVPCCAVSKIIWSTLIPQSGIVLHGWWETLFSDLIPEATVNFSPFLPLSSSPCCPFPPPSPPPSSTFHLLSERVCSWIDNQLFSKSSLLQTSQENVSVDRQ